MSAVPPKPATASDETYSQSDEDRLVEEFFGGRTGVFFEAGAFHPTVLSQTYLLEKHGWRGVLVEPQPDNLDEFARLRPNSRLVKAALGSPEEAGDEMTFVVDEGRPALAHLLKPGEKAGVSDRVITVPVLTISAVLEQAGVGRLDFLSLDLEGHELAALQGLDFTRWRPALILIEDHLHNLSKHALLQSRGYRLVYRTGSNNWYVPAGTPFPRNTPSVRLERFRKLYLSMPFRKLRVGLKLLRGREP